MTETSSCSAKSIRVVFAGCLATALAAPLSPGWAQESEADTTFEDVHAELSDAFEAIGGYTSDQRVEALAEMNITLTRLDALIEKLEARTSENWSDMSQATRAETSEALSSLRNSCDRLSEVYGALSQGADTAWDDVLSGVGSAWQDIEIARQKAATSMQSENTAGE